MLPIIMLTDRTDQADVSMARSTGINEFVVKPFSAKILFKHVEHIIEKRNAAIALEQAEAAKRASDAKAEPQKNDPMAINPVLLNSAQASIDTITADSMQWIKDDLAKIKLLHQKMISGETDEALIGELRDLMLAINSQANECGYKRAAEIAYKLHLFFRNDIKPNNAYHHMVVQKHIEVLQLIFGKNILGMGGNAGEQIAAELNNLMLKYAS